MSAWIFQVQSTIIVILMIIGILNRSNAKKHVKIMAITIIWDILLILQIELTRSAVLKASKVMTNQLILNIHVSLALSTVVCYFFMIYTGRKLLKNRTSPIRAKHKILGWTTFILRLATYATSFYTVS